MTTTIVSADQAIEKLTHDWHQLSDIDRALSLAGIKKSGLSSRRIATMMGRNESLIRRLLLLLSAPAADLAAAKHGRQRETQGCAGKSKTRFQACSEAR